MAVDLIDAKGEYFTKDAADVGTFTIDWEPFLAGDTISGTLAQWSMPYGITKDTQSQSTTTTTVKLSGGTAGIEYALPCTIISTAGNTWKKTLRIVVVPSPTLASNALIDLDYLKTFLRVYEAEPPQNIDNVLFGHLIDSASDQIERYCWRTFKTTDCVKRMRWGNSINLVPFPVHYVAGIYRNVREGFILTNAAVNKDYASAWITENRKLYLNISGGASHGIQSINLTLPANDTLAELITTINALPGNWTASLATDRTGYEQSEDLIAGEPGRFVEPAGLKFRLLGQPLNCGYELNEDAGILKNLYYGFSAIYYEEPVWIKFRGGYDVIPAALQATTARICQFFYAETKRDPGLGSERIGDYSYTRSEESSEQFSFLPQNLKAELDLWVDRSR